MFCTPSLRMAVHHFTYLQTVGGLDLLLCSFLLCSMLELPEQTQIKWQWMTNLLPQQKAVIGLCPHSKWFGKKNRLSNAALVVPCHLVLVHLC